ncbi:MAG TPA: PEP-CTERM sorting domain-containing protein, partial [Allocoleopsis sp.]
MNFRKPLVAAAAISALMSVAAPAQAFSFLGATSNADGSFSFASDTKVKFDFFASHGAYQSKFGVYSAAKDSALLETLFTEVQARDAGSGNHNDSKATCPVSVQPCNTSYKFLANVKYFFGLTAKEGAVEKKTVFTDPTEKSFNFVSGSETFDYYTNFKNNLGDRTKQTLTAAPGTTLIAVNDSWKGDRDYNDFIVKAEAVPEPGTIAALLGVGALGFVSRRRKANQA